MNQTSDDPAVRAIAEAYSQAVARGQRLCFFVCDVDLQQAELLTLEQAHATLRDAKRAAIRDGQENQANLYLGFESLTRAIADELKMWVALKEGRPHDAWVAFASAQEHACLGLRTPAGHVGVARYIDRLVVIEQTIFPRLQFMSAGLTHGGGICSICRQNYAICIHVEGRIYCGRVCAEVELRAVRFEHGSLVEVPRNKRCYVTEYTDSDGVWRDVMTRTPTGREGPRPEDGDGFRLHCVMLTSEAPPGVNV